MANEFYNPTWNQQMGNIGIPQDPNVFGAFAPSGPAMSMAPQASAPFSTFGSGQIDTSGMLARMDSWGTGSDGSGGFMDWIKNGQNLSAVAQGIGALTSAWLGYQNLRNARDQLSFQKDAFQKNFANQTKSYNTSLEDRIRGRTADYAGKEGDVQAYLDKHKLGG